MPTPWLIDVTEADDIRLCGGKAIGLAKLQRAGFSVPPALCVTTEFYRHWLNASGLAPRVAEVTSMTSMSDPDVRAGVLLALRRDVEAAVIPEYLGAVLGQGLESLFEPGSGTIAVRSSAPYEDGARASHAGIHASVVVPAPAVTDIVLGIKCCWASLWSERAWAYRERLGIAHDADPAMAVLVQRFVPAERSGVAFSVDPLTNDRTTVVIEAGWGDGEALVSGHVTPDEYRVSTDDGAAPVAHRPGNHAAATAHANGHVAGARSNGNGHDGPVLSEAAARSLTELVKRVEQKFGAPVDVEWVFDGRRFWAVQARPITTLDGGPPSAPTPATMWTRANLKEVFPDLPSPLALSYLTVSLNRMFHSYHAAQGYALPQDMPLVKVLRGRPYLNLSLMHRMTRERGGDPAVVARLLGGGQAPGAPAAPAAIPTPSLGNRLRLLREMLTTVFRTPARGRRFFGAMRRRATALRALPIEAYSDAELVAHLETFLGTLLDAATVTRLHEIVSAQSRAYMALEALGEAWMGADAAALVTRMMTGLGTLPNVTMTYRLMALGAMAAHDERARAFFSADLDDVTIRGYDVALAGTPVLGALHEFLHEFGHRGRYESDVMSPRFQEDPTPVLRLIQLYLRTAAREDPARHAEARRRVRETAAVEIRQALRRRSGAFGFRIRWWLFSTVCDALQRLCALRDECRHVTTMLVTHLRRVTLEIGRRATRAGVLDAPDDMFFLELDEIRRVLIDGNGGWRTVARARRQERDLHAGLDAPDVVVGSDVERPAGAPDDRSTHELVGLGVSPGTVKGHVKVVRSADDLRDARGRIVVFEAIEPTLTPIFPLVHGVIAEMGGLLSHAAILAREYGMPAIVDIQDATRLLRDGDYVELDGATGRVRVIERAVSPVTINGSSGRRAGRRGARPAMR